MAYDLVLSERIKSHLQPAASFEEKKMFGGVCYMVDGHLACGVHKDGLLVRLSADEYVSALTKPHTHPFELTRKPMVGWLVVDRDGIIADGDLNDWISQSLDFIHTLPPK